MPQIKYKLRFQHSFSLLSAIKDRRGRREELNPAALRTTGVEKYLFGSQLTQALANTQPMGAYTMYLRTIRVDWQAGVSIVRFPNIQPLSG